VYVVAAAAELVVSAAWAVKIAGVPLVPTFTTKTPYFAPEGGAAVNVMTAFAEQPLVVATPVVVLTADASAELPSPSTQENAWALSA
jgi:hypothetical protein